MRWSVVHGDARLILPKLPEGKIQTCVTSPPYFGLRSYDVASSWWGGDPQCPHQSSDTFVRPGISGGLGVSDFQHHHRPKRSCKGGPNFQITPDQEQAWCNDCGAWLGQLGQEPTPDLYVEHMVGIFREVKQVLRDDGTLWLNIADTWAGSGRGMNADGTHGKTSRKQASNKGTGVVGILKAGVPDGMKPKDLMGIPFELAKALRTDGWYWRSTIMWVKPNSFPEGSVADRPFKSYEFVFLLSKSDRYYYNRDAVTEAQISNPEDTKFLRDAWVIQTEASKLPHFAAFPVKLAERCILLGSKADDLVLDPFCGIGRAGIAALRNGRRFLGIDIGERYVEFAREQLTNEWTKILEMEGALT